MIHRRGKSSLLTVQMVAIGVLGLVVLVLAADRFRHRPSTQFVVDVERDKTTSVDGADAGMVQSVEDARASLSEFLQLASHALPSETEFAVKVPLGEREPKEFVWLNPFRVDADTVVGRISNEIEHQKQFRIGQIITMPLSEISDWTFKRGAVMLGNYSGCAILAHETKEAKVEFKSTYGLDCARHDLTSPRR